MKELEKLLTLPRESRWTVRCQDCAWTSEVPNFNSAQKWAKYHREHYKHRTLIRKGTEKETS
jgi:hypothetical protein